MFRWTGKKLEVLQQPSPLISSAVNYDSVQSSRVKTYEQMLAGKAIAQLNAEVFYQLHASHVPEKSACSICMHRSDAKTVSFSHIHVGNSIQFNYREGSPCVSGHWHVTEIKNRYFTA